jgi:hypothetical protein
MIEIIAGIFLGIFLTTGIFVENFAEKKLKKEINKIISPEKIFVNIKSSSFEILRGKINRVEITLNRFDFEGLKIDKFKSRSWGIKVKPKIRREIEIKEIKKTEFEFEIKEKDINDFLSKKVKIVKDFKISLNRDKFNISFYLLNTDFLLNPKVDMDCKISVFEGDKIYLEIPKVKIGILRIPQFIIDTLLNELNPIFNVKNFKFSKILFIEEKNLPGKLYPEIEKIEIENKTLKIWGEIFIDKNKENIV